MIHISPRVTDIQRIWVTIAQQIYQQMHISCLCRDPTSDMAMVSKKGSRLVKVHREQAERKKASKKEWELAGSKLGNLLGIQKGGTVRT